MKALVFSDSHGTTKYMYEAIIENKDCEKIIFLGDGEYDIRDLHEIIGNRSLVQVCGNCDNYSQLNEKELLKIEGHLIYVTHGHREKVKLGRDLLRTNSYVCRADLVLFGHTHFQEVIKEDNITFLNPGSIASGKYAILEITPNNIEIQLRK